MGHALGRELDVSPWDALLGTVRRAAAQSAWLQSRVGQLEGVPDEEFLPGGQHHGLLGELRKADDFLAKVANMAIKAGIAEKLVLAAQVQAVEMHGVIMSALDGLVDDETMTIIRGRMRSGLLALEAGNRTIEGESEEQDAG